MTNVDMNNLSKEQLQALVAKAIAENATLVKRVADTDAKLAKSRSVRTKVSEKGAISLYGLSARFPATFYKQQWEVIFNGETEKMVRALFDDPKVSQGKTD